VRLRGKKKKKNALFLGGPVSPLRGEGILSIWVNGWGKERGHRQFWFWGGEVSSVNLGSEEGGTDAITLGTLLGKKKKKKRKKAFLFSVRVMLVCVLLGEGGGELWRGSQTISRPVRPMRESSSTKKSANCPVKKKLILKGKKTG